MQSLATPVNSPVYVRQSSAVMVYVLPEPMNIQLSQDKQVDYLLSQAQLAEFNTSALAFLGGASAEAVRGQTLGALMGRAGKDQQNQLMGETRTRLKQFVGDGYNAEDIDLNFEWAGQKFFYKTSYYGFVDNAGFLQHLLVVHRDETARHHQEELVLNIAQNLAAEVDESFFYNLASHLAMTLELDYASVLEAVDADAGTAKLLAFYNRADAQHLSLNSDYCLQGTPGFNVLQGEVQIVSGGVSAQFPDDSYLSKLEIESYVGIPLVGENYQTLGLIAVMHGEEFPNVELVRSVLSIFSIRAAAEIERRRLRVQQSDRDRQQKIFIENNSSGMFVVDIDPPMSVDMPLRKQVQWLADKSRFVECNKSLISILDFGDKSEVLGKPLYGDKISYDFATHARAFLDENYQFRDHLICVTTEEGGEVWLSANISSVLIDGELTQMLGVLTDVSDRVSHTRSMEYRAKHDGLTGLPNRSNFIEQLELALSLAAVDSRHALFLLDLDGFKEVNDTLGHETGDFLLQEIGPRLQPVLAQANTLLARLGGDEFAVLIQDCGDEEQVTGLAQRMMDAIKSPFTINELELVVGGSVGIALFPANGESVSSLMRCADIAMYQAKQQSRDYCHYSPEQDHYTVRRLSLMMDARQAISNEEMRLFYQPIVELSSGKVLGFEALIRWQHPVHGMLPPGEFVPLIELTDMIMPMTWWVVENAIKQLHAWYQQDWPFHIAVNISTRNLVDVGFVDFIRSCLDRYQVDGRLLELEITESTLMADPEMARRVLQELSALGTPISIDDYGTGYSSLAYLKSLPITTLKIDRTFISEMLANPQDQIIVQSTVQLAHNLGLKVTAEGIEDLSLVESLSQLGCDKGQGYYLSRPMPVDELDDWLLLHKRYSEVS